MQIVWFKRDLRVHDHAPLSAAARRGAVLPLYIIEPSIIDAPDFDPAHYTFIRAGLVELRHHLAQRGMPLVVRYGEVIDVLNDIRHQYKIDGLWAHEETGNWLSFQRDIAVRAWAREQAIPFTEIPQTAAVRGLKDRDDWTTHWNRRMHAPLLEPPPRLRPVKGIAPGDIPFHRQIGLVPDDREGMQIGGESVARALLDTFLFRRGREYTFAMSSPVTADEHCSRLSPYLAWGNISTRQVVHAARMRLSQLYNTPRPEQDWDHPDWIRSVKAFQSRIHWRCHFIQKLETEPEIEYHNFMRTYDGLREDDFDWTRFDAWADGRTGYPLVDACMRYLRRTGWLNFRMRAMLVSFAAYSLWLHWREPALHLARLFVDYEPGIHYSQVQMQSGTTGINTPRLYNPTKQAADQDPDGAFIRQWVPELAGVHEAYLYQPWTMPAYLQERSGCIIGRDYPVPVVDHDAASREAKDRIYALRERPDVQAEAKRVLAIHGSRRGPQRFSSRDGVFPKSKPKQAAEKKPDGPQQMSLF